MNGFASQWNIGFTQYSNICYVVHGNMGIEQNVIIIFLNFH